MWRALLLVLGFLTVGALEFSYFPGHTYLHGSSQLYLPILEHLDAPGYLSRDLIAAHPNVSFTAYDEVTLFIHRVAKLDFYPVLVGQQLLGRLAGLLGLLLVARSAGLGNWQALLVSAFVHLGTFLPGSAALLIEPEPVPRAMALGLVWLAMGCLTRLKPLLAGLFAGLGFLYDPVVAGPFWLLVLVAFLFDRKLRKLLRPMLPVLLVFGLLLANLAQLQPGAPDTPRLFERMSAAVASIERLRVPAGWVSLWPLGAVYFYVALFVIGIAAVTRLWPLLNRECRWLFTLLPCLGLLSIPLSGLLVEQLRWPLALRLDVTRSLSYLVLLVWLAGAMACVLAWQRGRRAEACVWLVPCLLVLSWNAVNRPSRVDGASMTQMAAWAEENTWGSSVFLFPDAGRALYPGVFRARSRRALWVDWMSGAAVNSSAELAQEWWSRWKDTMDKPPLTGAGLQRLLGLPIDYYVFEKGRWVIAEKPVKPAFEDERFVVYEASTLRLVAGDLRIVRSRLER